MQFQHLNFLIFDTYTIETAFQEYQNEKNHCTRLSLSYCQGQAAVIVPVKFKQGEVFNSTRASNYNLDNCYDLAVGQIA